MKQHYTPQVYLRQWCDDSGQLLRFSRTGPPGQLQVREERRVPKAICWESDLYSIPEGGVANGLRGQQIEELLSDEVESKAIASIMEALQGRLGLLESTLAERVKWLMQTFVARSQTSLSYSVDDMRQWGVENRPMIERMLDRALTPEMRTELNSYIDPRMPKVAALAALAGIISSNQKPAAHWYPESHLVFVLSAERQAESLKTLGLDHFPTFGEPALEWDENPLGMVASFSVSPQLLAFIVQRVPQPADLVRMMRSHLLQGLPNRRLAVCRTRPVAGEWRNRLSQLQPYFDAA